MRRIPLSDDDELDPWEGPYEDPEFNELDFDSVGEHVRFGDDESPGLTEHLGDRVDDQIIQEDEEEELKKRGDDDLQAIVQYLEEV